MTIADPAEVAGDFHLRWAVLGAPQRPPATVVETMRPLIAGRPGPALQLGVTPEIAHLAAQGVAVDWNAEMIRLAWPGDSASHRAILGDWLALPFANAGFATTFGDGSLSTLDWPDRYRGLMESLARVLRPGGRLVLRCFVAPDQGETLGGLATAALAGEIRQFGAFKLRLNMAAIAETGRIANSGETIHRLFEAHFPDRAALARAAGWTQADIAGIDAYAGGASLHSYPTRAQIATILPAQAVHRFVDTDGYPLAERCPLLVVDFPVDRPVSRQPVRRYP